MIDTNLHTKLSKFLSLVLRHKPETIGIALDSQGWTSVVDLMEKMNLAGRSIDFETLEHIVDTNSKKRFAFNADKTLIRANQGHSIAIDLGYAEKIPPDILYHGTGHTAVDSIFKNGILKMNRHHVHLSQDKATAIQVGQRHGRPVIFEIQAAAMADAGYIFYESDNGVWLTDEVPVQFINKI